MTKRERSDTGEALRELKRRVRSRYLGKHGVHAVGTHPASDTLRVYVTPGTDPRDPAFRSLESDLAPHRLEVIVLEPASHPPTREPDDEGGRSG